MVDTKINALGLCAGVGMLDEGVRFACEYFGFSYKTVAFAEWEGYPAQQLVTLMETGAVDQAPVWCGDFADLDWKAFHGVVDAFVAGYPCFVAGTLILTKEGYRPIEELRVGDMVLTHKGRWRAITATMGKTGARIREIHAQGCARIRTTDEHPFYVVARRNAESNEATWIDAKSIIPGIHRLTQVLPRSKQCRFDESILWLIGRFLADGWIVDRKYTGSGKPVKKEQGKVVICCNKKEADELAARIKAAGFKGTRNEERTVIKFQITGQHFWRIAKQFGRLAHRKILPGWCLELNESKSKALLAGYLSGDGCVRNGLAQITTVSKALAYGIALLVQRSDGVVASVSHARLPKRTIIEGRECNQRDQWQIRWYPAGSTRGGTIDGRYAFKSVRSNEYTGTRERVYNISVEEDESYMADGAVVHNCQAWSTAGKRLGFADKRWVWGHIEHGLSIVRPRFVYLENVRGLISGGGLGATIAGLSRLGYDTEWSTLYASSVGASHQRDRVFIFGFMADDNGRRSRRNTQQQGGLAVTRRSKSMVNTNSKFYPTRNRHQFQSGFITDASDQMESLVRQTHESENKYRRKEHTKTNKYIDWSDEPLFTPGQNDPQWNQIIRERPDLKPTIERDVRLLVDGLAPVLGKRINANNKAGSRKLEEKNKEAVIVDLMQERERVLRCAGNGVVPQQAAAAYIELMKRAGVQRT